VSRLSAPAWFVLALVPMVASQIVRLHQHDAESWIFWDYAGRLGGLAVLAAIPSARDVAFRYDKRKIPLWEIPLWIVGVVVADFFFSRWTRRIISNAFPQTVLGVYPRPSGSLYLLDLLLGLALVAYSEEVVFRRCASNVFKPYSGDGYALVFTTSVLFGCFHWWTGLGNMVAAAATGVPLMLLLLRSGVLWPAVLAHYLVDIVYFT